MSYIKSFKSWVVKKIDIVCLSVFFFTSIVCVD